MSLPTELQGYTKQTHEALRTKRGAGHLMGTMRMGTNPTTSVVDPHGRSHAHPHLWVVGSSVFPTGGTANRADHHLARAHSDGQARYNANGRAAEPNLQRVSGLGSDSTPAVHRESSMTDGAGPAAALRPLQ